MVFDGLLQLVGDLPCFSARFLAAGENLAQVRLQLARWVHSGRIIKLHKGFYTLAAPYRKIQPDPFHISNALKSPSYVSLQSALSWHGLIPEFVPAVTAVTTARPADHSHTLGAIRISSCFVRFVLGLSTGGVFRPARGVCGRP